MKSNLFFLYRNTVILCCAYCRVTYEWWVERSEIGKQRKSALVSNQYFFDVIFFSFSSLICRWSKHVSFFWKRHIFKLSLFIVLSLHFHNFCVNLGIFFFLLIYFFLHFTLFLYLFWILLHILIFFYYQYSIFFILFLNFQCYFIFFTFLTLTGIIRSNKNTNRSYVSHMDRRR